MVDPENKMDGRFAIASSRVVTPAGEVKAAIVIEDGKIVEVIDRESVPADIPLTDFGGLVISPGVIDAHVHVNEPGRTDWEGFETATTAAALGGVTTIIDMPLNSSPVTTDVAALNAKRTAAEGKCRVNVGFYGGLVPGNETELEPLIEEGVFGIKAFMCHSGLDEFPGVGAEELRLALQTLKRSRLPLLAHAEIVGDVAPMSDPESYSQYAASRPESFETQAIDLLIDLCREFQSPVQIVHLAAASAIESIQNAKLEGLPLTVETCPHYLFFVDHQIANGQTQFKCAPPIRDANNRKELCMAVQSGLIETIGSDHSPCPPGLKHLDDGDFEKAWGGIASLQLLLSASNSVARFFRWSPELLAQRLSKRPAEILGLGETKGQIKAGYDADLVVWDPRESFICDGETLAHRHKVTPYEDSELFGVVKATFVLGRMVCRDGELIGEPGGKLLRRTHSDSIANFLGQLPTDQRQQAFESCCASPTWIQRMMSSGDFRYDVEVLRQAEDSFTNLGETDLLEAFSAHPRIGDVDSLRKKYANTKTIASGEQSGVDSATEEVLQRLANANDEYFDKFGFIFIVCATGKSAKEMLEILEARLPNDRDVELANAANEQVKITKIRLRKLIL